MTFTLFIPPVLFGHSIFIELLNNPVSDKMLDWNKEIADTEVWVAGKLHIVISNEKYYEKRRNL